MTPPNIVALNNPSETNGLFEGAKTDSKLNKRNIAIAIGVIVAISLVAVALLYAEVKWGLLSAGIVWALGNPLVSTVVTLLVIGGIAYAVYRYLKPPVPETSYAFLEKKVATAHAAYLEAKRKFQGCTLNSSEGNYHDYLREQGRLREELIEAELGLRNAVEKLGEAITSDKLYTSIVDKYPYDCSEFLTLQEQ